MTNTFANKYTAEMAVEVAATAPDYGFRLASICANYGPAFWTPGAGDTVFLTVGGILTAHGRKISDGSNAIILDKIAERREPVKLDTHAYSAVPLTEADLSLDITDFSAQVLVPQADSVVHYIENSVADTIAAIPVTGTVPWDPAKPLPTFTALRAALRGKGVDVVNSRLIALVGANVADALLDSGALDAQETGGDASALRNATIGKLRGFEVVESNAIDDDAIIGLTDQSIYLAHKAPEVPQGASFGATTSTEKISMRYLRDYDVMTMKDRSVVSSLVGVGISPLYDVTRTADTGVQGDEDFVAGTAELTKVEGGAIVAVSTQ